MREWQQAPAALRAKVLATVLFVRDGKKTEAVALLERYLAEHPEDLEMTRQLAGYLDKMGEQKKAIDLLSKAPGVETDARLLVARALARRSLQDFAGALRDFEAADRIDPENESVINNRPSFDRLRTAVAGIRAASNVLAEQPGDSAALISRAYWYLSTGAANGAAFNDAEAAQKVDPGSVAALILFAEASNRTGRLSAKDAREKLEVDVSKPIPTLAVLTISGGRTARFSKIRRMSPPSSGAASSSAKTRSRGCSPCATPGPRSPSTPRVQLRAGQRYPHWPSSAKSKRRLRSSG